MRTLYPTINDTPTGLAQDIIKEALDTLQEPEKSQGIAVTKALAALIRGSRKLLLTGSNTAYSMQHLSGNLLSHRPYLSYSDNSTSPYFPHIAHLSYRPYHLF